LIEISQVFPGHCINDRQPEIADDTGNTHISETITESIEISTQIWGLRPWRARKNVGKWFLRIKCFSTSA